MEHQLVLSFQKGTAITAVCEVEGFSEKEIKLKLEGAKKLLLCGNNLKITDFSKQSGALQLSGEVSSIRYSQKGDGFVKRLFK